MRSKTVTRALAAPRDEVFDYLADVENLPAWATEFARELKVVDGRHKVVNGLGELFFRIEADERTGVIDMFAGPTPEAMALFPTRVVELPGGWSAFTFTMFQGSEMSDELFESQHASLLREFDNIERRFGR
jgi:uncharacterized protein YndB with AHSA1/START domain